MVTQEVWHCVCNWCSYCSLCLFCSAALCFLLLFLCCSLLLIQFVCCSLLLQVFLLCWFLVPFLWCGLPVGHSHSGVSLSWCGSPVGCSPTGVSLLRCGSPVGHCPSVDCRVFTVPVWASCPASCIVKLVSLYCEVKISGVLLILLELGSWMLWVFSWRGFLVAG